MTTDEQDAIAVQARTQERDRCLAICQTYKARTLQLQREVEVQRLELKGLNIAPKIGTELLACSLSLGTALEVVTEIARRIAATEHEGKVPAPAPLPAPALSPAPCRDCPDGTAGTKATTPATPARPAEFRAIDKE